MVLALIAVLATPMAALAMDRTGTTEVTGLFETYYTIEVPTTVPLGTLSTSAFVESPVQTITTKTNDQGADYTSAVVKVRGGTAAHPGQLKLSDVETYLSPGLRVRSALIGWDNTAITETDTAGTVTLDHGTTASPIGTVTCADVYIKQPAITSPSPVPAGDYSLTLTFTATFSKN